MFISRRVLVAGAVVVLAFFAGSTFASGGGGFSDVPSNHQFADEIAWMADNGIAGGYDDGSYRPGQAVTRQAMAAFMVRLNAAYYVTMESEDPASASAWVSSANCNLGDRALMGSGTTSAANMFITDSSPIAEGTWQIRWESDSDITLNPSQLTVYVLCAPPRQQSLPS